MLSAICGWLAVSTFTNAKEYLNAGEPQAEPDNPGPNNNEVNIAAVCLNAGESNASAGCGIWLRDGSEHNTSIRIPQNLRQTSNSAEIVAVISYLQQTRSNRDITFQSQSNTLLKVNKNLERWKQLGYISISNGEVVMPLAALLKQYTGQITFEQIKESTKGTKEAHTLAASSTNRETADPVNLHIQKEWRLPGAQLSVMSQSVLYLGIQTLSFPKKLRQPQNHETTRAPRADERMLEKIRTAIKSITGRTVTDQVIWTKNTRSRNATKEQNVWCWKTIHNLYWVGRKWLHFPGFEDRATCQHCNETEDMEHILTKCTKPGQELVWDLTWAFLAQKEILLPLNMPIGLILGCALTDFKNQENKPIKGGDRLVEITIREGAQLIWQLRNEHVIKNENDPTRMHSNTEITNRLTTKLNNRLQLDRTLTNKLKFGKKALPKAVVLDTWSGTLSNKDLPGDWISTPGVLVGMGMDLFPRGRNRWTTPQIPPESHIIYIP
jgi:ribonuclease HI